MRSIDFPEQYNLVSHFVDRHLHEGRAGKTAVIFGGRTYSYGELAELVNRAGNGLLELGVQEEQRVMLVLPDSPEFVAAYFGVMKIGAVAVPTSTALRAPDYAYFLTESRARVLIVDSSLYPELAPALSGQRYLRHVIVCGESAPDCIAWEPWCSSQASELDAAPTHRDDVAFWLWTSGSTGRPKAAIHLHRDWLYCCEYYARGILEIHPNDLTFSTSKLFHAYGLGNGLMFPFYSGATTILCAGKPHAKAVLETVQARRPTLFFSVPTLYAAMLRETDHAGYNLNGLRLAVSAAEPLPAPIFRNWKDRFGIEILDGIGSTEVLHIYISARPGQVRPGSTGQVVPGYEARIVNSDGKDCFSGTIGDLLVRGESTAPCYWNRKRMTTDRMRGEWFFTGDKFRQDEDGYFWYAGRSDDMFRVSGQWVSPIEVESALIEHPVVLEAAVVSFEEETKLHTPKAFVVLKDKTMGNADLVEALQHFVKQQLAAYKYPRRIEFVTDLPKNAAGKLLRYKLRESAQ